MIVGTWWSTHIIFNLIKKTLVLGNCFLNEQKVDTGLVANIPLVNFFRLGLFSLYTVVFGLFPRPQNIIFGKKKVIFGTFFTPIGVRFF